MIVFRKTLVLFVVRDSFKEREAFNVDGWKTCFLSLCDFQPCGGLNHVFADLWIRTCFSFTKVDPMFVASALSEPQLTNPVTI